MTQPYLPITCEEFSVVQEDGLVDWPSQKLRILGKLVKETTEKEKTGKSALKRLKKIRFTNTDNMLLESIGEPTKVFIQLDFSLVPEKIFKFEYGDIVQVLGESQSNNGETFIQVHIIKNFCGVNVEKYHLAISQQSLACPRMSLRRQMLDTVLSPSPHNFLSSLPVGPDLPFMLCDINQAMVASPDGMGIILIGGNSGSDSNGKTIFESRFDGYNFLPWQPIDQELDIGRMGHVVIPIPKSITNCMQNYSWIEP